MRALVIVACTALAAVSSTPVFTPVFAQDNRIGVTLYGGLSVATLRGDSVPGPLHTTGFAGGAAITWPLANHLALEPELQFVQKGDDEIDTFSGGTFTEHIRLNYVEVPVLLRVAANPVAHVTPFIVGGPQIAFKASCSIVVHGLPGNYTCSDLPPAESTDWGIVAGGGLELPVGRQAVSVSARYDWGLRDVFKDNIAKTRTLLVLLGWRVL